MFKFNKLSIFNFSKVKKRSLTLYRNSLGITGFSIFIFFVAFIIIQAVSLFRFTGCSYFSDFFDCDDYLKWIHYVLIALGVILIVISFAYIAYMCQFYVNKSVTAATRMTTEMNSFQNPNMNAISPNMNNRY